MKDQFAEKAPASNVPAEAEHGSGTCEGAGGKRVAATLDAMGELTEYIEGTLEAQGAPMGAVIKMNIALDEIFSNIAKFSEASYAYIRCGVEGTTAFLTFEDDGKPYDPLEAKEPDTTLGADERDIGGLGIFMVKKSMSEMHYEYADGRNRLTLKLKFK